MFDNDVFGVKRIDGGLFDYQVALPPIDFFEYSLSMEQMINNVSGYESGEDKIIHIVRVYQFVKDYVSSMDGEPHTIRFVAIPGEGGYNFELVVVAKVLNNVTSYVFSDNKNFLESIKY